MGSKPKMVSFYEEGKLEALVLLLKNLPVPAFLCKKRPRKIIAVNKAACQLYGYSEKKFLQMQFDELLIDNKTPFKHKTGTGKPVNVKLAHEEIELNGRKFLLLQVCDVTEEAAALDKLLISEEKYRTTLYSIGDGVIVTDDRGCITIMNPMAEKLTGWSEKDAKGKKLVSIFKIVNEFSHKKVENPVYKVLRKGIVVGLANHTLLISKDGSEIPILDCAAPIKDKRGKLVGVVLVFRDQTKEREAQRKIEEARKFADSIIETIREPLVVLDKNFKIIRANKSFYSKFLTNQGKVEGRFFFDIDNGAWDIPDLKKLIKKILPQNTSFNDFEVEHRFPRIGKKTMLLNARRIYRDGNKTEMILLAIEDITKRKEDEEKIKKYNQLYQVLSNVNQAIVRINDEKELLATIAQIAVTKGDFNFACIGKLSGKSIEIVSKSGNEELFPFENIPVYKTKSNLLIDALLKKEKQIINNLQNFNKSKYLKRAVDIGAKSCALLPITLNGESWGLLILISETPKLFDADEINLLDELILDISFALEYYRKEKERLIAEKAVHESEALYRTLLESSEDSIYLVGTDGRYLYVNNKYLSRLGMPAEEIIGKHYSEFHTPDGTEDFLARINYVISNKKSVTYEYRSNRDGHYFIRTLSPVIDKVSNAVNAVTIISKDITERRLTELQLKESEEKFRKLAESTNTAIFIYKNTKFVYVNRATEILTGYSAEELYEMNFWDVVHPDDRELIIRRGMARLRGEAVPSAYEFKVSRRDGMTRWVSFTATLIDYQGETAAIGTAFDITEKKFAEEALRESEERFRTIFENLTVGVYRADFNGRLIMVNPSFVTMLGYENEEEMLKNNTIKDFCQDLELRNKFYNILLEEGIVYRFEEVWKKRDGKLINVKESARAYKDDKGNISFYECVVEDITILKNAERELILAKEKAEKADRIKTNFLAQISHEIRTPINVIVNFNNLIKEEIKNYISDEIMDGFSAVEQASRRIIRTIDLILNVAEIQTNAYDPIFRNVNIKDDIITNVIMEYSIYARIKNLSLSENYQTDQLNVCCDEYSVSQIIANLVDNAIKYTPEGKVELNVRRNEYNKLVVEIKDTGVGMSDDFLSQLFKPFTQEESGYTRKYEGSGLGLALVKYYCELNNIDINVESKKSHGTKFTLIFS
ncbi:PAS domain S-box protein [Melioribacter sp. OK-6-Me]|uniref:PAS domain S-box protein n=1 Tax=unclassified Melioribacter TaxID=2627329 RepID=UPI003ED9D56E